MPRTMTAEREALLLNMLPEVRMELAAERAEHRITEKKVVDLVSHCDVLSKRLENERAVSGCAGGGAPKRGLLHG